MFDKPNNIKVSDLKETDYSKSIKDFENIYENSLDCSHYQYELKKSCGITGAFRKFYRSEEQTHTCQQYQDLYMGCLRYQIEPSANLDKLLKMKRYENELIKKRIDSIKQNDVWELRSSPPSDWNAQLPEWCARHLKESIWYQNSEDQK